MTATYNSVQAAPNNELTNASPKPMAAGPMLESGKGEPFASANVVANNCVGLGDPLTVTVAAEGFVDG